MALSKKMQEVLKRRMNQWNNNNPVDLVWREHFKIPFGSKQHLEADMFHQQIWWEEYQEIQKIRGENSGVIEEGGQVVNLDEVGDGGLTEEEFMNLDMSQFKNQ